MEGAQLLKRNKDELSNFWYTSEQRQEVRQFYHTCVPTCADDADTYHSSKDMCLVSNDIARVWLQGNGQHCQVCSTCMACILLLIWHPERMAAG